MEKKKGENKHEILEKRERERDEHLNLVTHEEKE